MTYFNKFKNCILVFIKDPNLKSVSATLKDYQNKRYYKKGKDKLIRNYGLGRANFEKFEGKKNDFSYKIKKEGYRS